VVRETAGRTSNSAKGDFPTCPVRHMIVLRARQCRMQFMTRKKEGHLAQATVAYDREKAITVLYKGGGICKHPPGIVFYSRLFDFRPPAQRQPLSETKITEANFHRIKAPDTVRTRSDRRTDLGFVRNVLWEKQRNRNFAVNKNTIIAIFGVFPISSSAYPLILPALGKSTAPVCWPKACTKPLRVP